MRKAIKKATNTIYAYQLGEHSSMEEKLIAEGKINITENGDYELFSREAVNEHGQLAKVGDYFKMDSNGYPYPNSKIFFEKHHNKIGQNQYIQILSPLDTWTIEEAECEVMTYLLDNNLITINPDDKEKYFNTFLWGCPLSAAIDAVLVFYDVERTSDGKIESVDFSFVAKEEFDKTYKYLK